MAISLTANSIFQPFTYQELAAPIMEMSNYQDKMADTIDSMSAQADVLEAMEGNDLDRDSQSYKRYKSYSDSLRREANELYAYGVSTDARQRITDMRRGFSTQIVPIRNAWQKREQEAAAQMNAITANPSIMFTRDANRTSIDDYVKNPNGGYGVISGANIAAQVSGIAKNLAKDILSGKAVNVDSMTKNYIEKHGYTEDMVRDWRRYPSLRTAVEQVLKANGITDQALANSPNKGSIMDKALGYAEMGLWDSIGETKTQLFDNKAALEALRHKYAMARQAAAQQPKLPPGFPRLPGDTKRINFGDPTAAGASARQALAGATYDLLQRYAKGEGGKRLTSGELQVIKNQLKKYRDKEHFVNTWSDKGLGNLIGTWGIRLSGNKGKGGVGINTKAYDILSNELINQGFDRDLTNLWLLTRGTNSKPKGNNYIPTTPNAYTSQSGVPPTSYFETMQRGATSITSVPDWKKFDEKAHEGYYTYAVQLADDKDQLKEYLKDLITTASFGNKVNIYDIKKVHAAGSNGRTKIDYGAARTSLKDLPVDSSGNIKYDEIVRVLLPDGNIGLSWTKDGKNYFRGIKAEDISVEAQKFRDYQTEYLNSLHNLYLDNKISDETYNKELAVLYYNRFMDETRRLERTKVEDYKVPPSYGEVDDFEALRNYYGGLNYGNE